MSYYLLVMYLFVYCITYVYVAMGHVHMDFESFQPLLKLLNKKKYKINKVDVLVRHAFLERSSAIIKILFSYCPVCFIA